MPKRKNTSQEALLQNKPDKKPLLPSVAQSTTNIKSEKEQSNLVVNSTNTVQINTSQLPPLNPPKVIMPPDSMQSSNIQKRRRVVRACDRCRKLKIKCSGDLPCIHCTVYSYECTYDQPNRSKKKASNQPNLNTSNNNNDNSSNNNTSLNNNHNNNNGNNNSNNSIDNLNKSQSTTISLLASTNPELLSKLTDRLKLYDDILHRLIPDIKLTDLNDNPKPINPMKLMSALNKLREMGNDDSKMASKQITEIYESLPEVPLPVIPTVKLPLSNNSGIITPIPADKALPSSSNTAIKANTIINNNSNISPVSRAGASLNFSTINIQQPSPTLGSPYQGIDGSLESSMGKEIKIILPSREIALDLITKTWENACVLFRFYHRPAFIEDLNELYDTDPGQYTNKQQRFLPLVYSVMACGALFFKSDENTLYKIKKDEIGPQKKDFEDEGYKYFIAARKLIDITDTRDTYGIQTIVMLIIFLQCSARLSTCYAYIGIALRAALREGLHRKLDYPFNPIELEIRKRLFWTIYKMDIYVNTMLGLPRTISADDFDQDMPIELDDENITVNGYRYDRQGDRLSSSGIANAHTRLIFLMKEVVTKLYPIKPKKVENGLKPDLLAHNIVYDLELKLQDWMNGLPLELKPGVEPPGQYLKGNRLLHISYLHVKIILYRPFIHYISTSIRQTSSNDLACIEKAKNCINVARIVVKLAEDMIKKNMLSGSYWFSIYTIFFSVACLVYYVHFAPTFTRDGSVDPEYIAIKKDAENGKRVLDILKDSSMAARRTYNILNALFEQLNRRTARAGVNNDNPFIPPQLGKVQFEQKQQHNPQQADDKPYKMDNSQIKNLSNGVNFIDGVSTGINLNVPMSENLPQQQSIPLSHPSSISQQQQQQVISIAQQQALSRSNIEDFSKKKNPGYSDVSDYKYVPGPMDQMDMKIFGRFLPPYMLNQNQGSEISSSSKDNQSDIISNRSQDHQSTTSSIQNSKSQEEQQQNEPQKQIQQQQKQSTVFQPTLGLFNFVNDGKNSSSNNSNNNNGTNTSNSKSPDMHSNSGNDNWLNGSLLDTTNDFFNQVTNANAIPSGLSTVVQSENNRGSKLDELNLDYFDNNDVVNGNNDSNNKEYNFEELIFSNWDQNPVDGNDGSINDS